MGDQQMVFTGESGCPHFSPNPFKADMCVSCQSKIQAHMSATPGQVAAALEFSVDSLPSLIKCDSWGGRLYLGGYKAAVNLKFLKREGVTLVVNTARGLETTLGPRYLRQVERRGVECPMVQVDNSLLWVDSEDQELPLSSLSTVCNRIIGELEQEGSVLVHCAQGRSRSCVVVVATLCWHLSTSVEDSLALVKSYRAMAQPNHSFLRQLKRLEQTGAFKERLEC